MKSVMSVFCILLAVSGTAFGDISLKLGQGTIRDASRFPASASGITYAGGNSYYVVADDNSTDEVGLYPVEISLTPSGEQITNYTVGARIALDGATDLEAVAYDPASGHIWAANETGTKTIREYDPKTGAILSTLDVPAIMQGDYGNLGFESLTISGDGLTLWMANEESLKVDGPRSSMYESCTNRLVKFTREAVKSPWKLAAMYPYVTDKWHNEFKMGGSARRGISDMCALPDGSLLVMERELSATKDGSDTTAKASGTFYLAIYRLTAEALAAATDVQDFASLANGGWTAVEKGVALCDRNEAWKNFEGLCLGARTESGRCVLMTLTDAGDGYTTDTLRTMVIYNLDVVTLNCPAPALPDYVPSLVGSNYRFVSNTVATVSLAGEGLLPTVYTNNNVTLATANWALASGRASGTGPVASFAVTGDDTLDWSVETSAASTPIIGYDTFEEVAAGTDPSALPGWTGGGSVVAATYVPPAVGTPMQKAAHQQVLSVVDSVSRTYTPSTAGHQTLDMMIEITRPKEDSELDASACQAGVRVFSDGRFRVLYRSSDGTNAVAVASDTVYANGDWVRVTMSFDYSAAVPTFSLRLNGELCGTYPCIVAKTGVSGVEVTSDTKLDDVILTTGEAGVEIADDPAHPAKLPADVTIPSVWFDRNGLAWYSIGEDADGDGLLNGWEYLAGTSPTDADSTFAITGFTVADGAVELTFTGELPRPDLLTVKWCEALGGDVSTASGTVTTANGVSVCRIAVPSSAHFFRAVLGE